MRADESPRAIVQEADCAERVIVLKIRVPGLTSLVLIGAARAASGAGVLSPEERRRAWGARLPPGSVRQRAREEALAGATVVALSDTEVFIEQDGVSRVVRPQGGRVVVTDAPKTGDATPFIGADEAARSRRSERGLSLAAALADDAVEIHRAELGKLIERALAKIDRRREAIRGDLAKIADADRIAAQAQWLVAEAARAPRGATKLVVTDWSSGEAVPMTIPLDPSKSAREQVEAMFKRAKRLRLGARIAEGRLAQADRQRESLELAQLAIQEASTLGALDEAAHEAKRAAPRDLALPQGTITPGAPSKKKKGARTPYRTFFARSGKKLLVGKGAADNDALTLHVARPHDLWCHAKDRTGAHVIVTLDKGQTCPAEDLVDAAHLAAHFSEARDEKVVDVQYTDRRYLRKPKGSPPGFVIVDREKVLVLRVEAEILRALLEREDV
jgi:predicted ribosome quality control (RQC) complex YloA/Tae2 family protein